MCRNIKKLRRSESDPTNAELHDAALQFVRKISGYRVPSHANEQTFERAVKDIAAASRMMFRDLAVGKCSAHSEAPVRSPSQQTSR